MLVSSVLRSHEVYFLMIYPYFLYFLPAWIFKFPFLLWTLHNIQQKSAPWVHHRHLYLPLEGESFIKAIDEFFECFHGNVRPIFSGMFKLVSDGNRIQNQDSCPPPSKKFKVLSDNNFESCLELYSYRFSEFHYS